MAITKDIFNNAFREVITQEYINIPNEDDIEYSFSGKFEKKMQKLIKSQKRTYWHLINTATKKAAVVFLTCAVAFSSAMTVRSIREPVVEFLKETYDTIANYFSVGEINKKAYDYYGTYNGYQAILYKDATWQVLSEIEVGGHIFKFSTSNKILMYKDGIYLDFDIAFLLGKITQEDIDKLYENYTNSKPSCKALYSDYYDLLDDIKCDDVSERERYLRMSKIFRGIWEGREEEKAELEKLFVKITYNSLDFDNVGVFETARYLSDFYYQLSKDNDTSGIDHISITDNSISMQYINVKKYEVKMLSSEDKEIFGDTKVEYNGELGEYRIQITFFDAKPASDFLKKYKVGSVYEVDGYNDVYNLKFKWCYNSDHGFVLYFGSDKPLNVTENVFEINNFKDIICIDLN